VRTILEALYIEKESKLW